MMKKKLVKAHGIQLRKTQLFCCVLFFFIWGVLPAHIITGRGEGIRPVENNPTDVTGLYITGNAVVYQSVELKNSSLHTARKKSTKYRRSNVKNRTKKTGYGKPKKLILRASQIKTYYTIPLGSDVIKYSNGKNYQFTLPLQNFPVSIGIINEKYSFIKPVEFDTGIFSPVLYSNEYFTVGNNIRGSPFSLQ